MYNTTRESNLPVQKLNLVVVVVFPWAKVIANKSVRKEMPIVVNVMTFEEWNSKFSSLFESGSTYGKSDFLNKMRVCHKEID